MADKNTNDNSGMVEVKDPKSRKGIKWRNRPVAQKLTGEKGAIYGRFRATYRTIADAEDLPLKTVEAEFAREDSEFSIQYKKALSTTKMTLAEAQMKSAVELKNPTMLIWLGKQYLDQTDKSEVKTIGETKIMIVGEDEDGDRD